MDIPTVKLESVELTLGDRDAPEEKEEEDAENTTPVLSALQHGDWNELRRLSLRHGGFGQDRRKVWPFLLHASKATVENPTVSLQRDSIGSEEKLGHSEDKGTTELDEKERAHPDTNQIKLDTDRSFVYYPVDSSLQREALQSDLNRLLNDIFRRRPKLSYFQGFHDIITVLYLTLSEEDQLICSEKISLHRLRDSMGRGLEPMIGLLRIFQRIMRLVDSDFAALIERSSPLPYFSLSSLLTIFSHDTPTLPQIQCIFDYLFCRHPVASIYLAVAVTLTHRNEAFRLEEVGEEGMLHSLLSSLPDFKSDDDEENPKLKVEENHTSKSAVSLNTNSSFADGALEESQIVDISGSIVSTEQSEISFDHEQDFLSNSEISEIISSESTSQNGQGALDSSTSSPTCSTPANSSTYYPSRCRLKVPLPTLLAQADELHDRFPPSHLEIQIESIMGPCSVLNTWSEDPTKLMSDDDAEEMVLHPESVVRPEPQPSVEEEDEALIIREKELRKRRYKKLRTGKGGYMIRIERRTLVASVVLVLGIAIAVYGVRFNGAMGATPNSFRARNGRDWRRLAQWVGGIVLGAGETLRDVFQF